MEHLDSKGLKALGVETRQQIMKRLASRPYTASELSRILNKHVTTIVEHMEQLETAGLVQRKNDGHKWVYYSLSSKGEHIFKPQIYSWSILLSLSIISIVLGGFLAGSQIYGPYATVPGRLNSGEGIAPAGDIQLPPAESQPPLEEGTVTTQEIVPTAAGELGVGGALSSETGTAGVATTSGGSGGGGAGTLTTAGSPEPASEPAPATPEELLVPPVPSEPQTYVSVAESGGPQPDYLIFAGLGMVLVGLVGTFWAVRRRSRVVGVLE